MFASVRERWRVSRILGIRKWPRIHTELSFFGNCHRDREGLGRKTQICRHFWTRTWSPRFNSVHNHKDRGVLVAKCRTVVRFGLALDRHLKIGNCHRDREGLGRKTQICRHFLVAASQQCQQSQGSGGSWSQNADLLSVWTRLWSPRLKSGNCHKDREGLGRKTQICRHFLVAACQKCQQSQGSGGSLSQNAEQSSVLDSPLVAKWQQSQGSGGPCRKTQICRHFWTRVWSTLPRSIREKSQPSKQQTYVVEFDGWD